MLGPEVWEKLEACDWAEVGLRVTRHAYYKLGKSIIGGMVPSDDLRRQKAEDIAAEAIESVLTGTRKWKPEEQPDLLTFLKNVADSKISHFLNSGANRSEQQAPVDGFHVPVLSRPDAELVYRDIRERLGSESDLIELLDSIWSGCMTGGDLAEDLGITPAEVVNRRKRLRRRTSEMGYCPTEEMVH